MSRASSLWGALFLIFVACEPRKQPKRVADAWPTPLAPLAGKLGIGPRPVDCGAPCGCLDPLANAALNQGMEQDLLSALPKLEEPCRSSPTAIGIRAEALARQKRWPESESAAEEATRSAGPHPFAHYALALGALNRMSMQEAEGATARAEEDGRGPEVHRAYGQIALARGKFPECAEHFKKLAAAFPGDVEAYFNHAVCEANAKHYKNAREAFLKTLKLSPQHAKARFMLTLLTSEIGAWEEAAHHLKAYSKLVPDDPNLATLKKAIESRGEFVPERAPSAPSFDGGFPSSAATSSGDVPVSGISAKKKDAAAPAQESKKAL